MTRRLTAPQHARQRRVPDPWVPGILLACLFALVVAGLIFVGG